LEIAESPYRKEFLASSINPLREINDDIMEKNNFKKGKSILNNLYRIDDRSKSLLNFIAIKFKQAKNQILTLTNKYLQQHYVKGKNSRDAIKSIEENDWKEKKRAKKLGLDVESDKTEDRY
jgi:hypothetical protein